MDYIHIYIYIYGLYMHMSVSCKSKQCRVPPGTLLMPSGLKVRGHLRNMFQRGLVFKARRLTSRLESDKEEEDFRKNNTTHQANSLPFRVPHGRLLMPAEFDC